jgi:hypothetical protein
MKLSRIIIVVLVVIVVVVFALYALGALFGSSPACTSTWNCGAGYPLQVGGTLAVAGQQCVADGTYVYCIGGQDVNGGPRSDVYSSTTSPSGNITSWTLDSNHYPQSINGQSCVLYSDYVYCVGGTYNDNGDDVASSYYAQLGSAGQVGNWSTTTAFPIPVDTQSCVASSSYIYCVGGVNETDGSNADAVPSNSVWYAQLSSSGIGSWSQTAAYPANVYYPSCFAANGYIYCIGGADSNNNAVSTAYYAALSAAGVGTWTQTTAYPVKASGQACVISSGYIYCVGGETSGGQSPGYTNSVYSAPVSLSGIGTWKQASNFPVSVQTDCVVSSGSIYCIGGFDGSSAGENNAVHYASLASLTS